MNNWLGKAIIQGLVTTLPLILSLAVLYWGVTTIEQMLAPIVSWLVGDFYFTGLGLLLALFATTLIGILVRAWLVRTLWRWFEKGLGRLPLVSTLYNSIQDLLSLFNRKDQSNQFDMVVTLNWGGQRVLGFVTRAHFDDVPDGIGEDGDLCVYVPMGYQLGGFTFIVNRDDVNAVEGMSVDEAMKFALTAGVSKPRSPN